jgi:hypothetical protein
MPMHTIAFSQSIAENSVESFITAVPDQSVRTSVNDIIVPDVVKKIIGTLACSGSLATRTKLISPSLRRTNPYEIQPLQLGLVPQAVCDLPMHPGSPQDLDYNEALNCQVNSTVAAAEQQSVAVFLSDGVPAPVTGKIIHVRFSVLATLVAGQWVNGLINFVDGLPTGIYSVVGSQLVAPSGVVARWYPVGGKWRPGFPVSQLRSDRCDPLFRNGEMGKWFDFDEVQPPTIDILSSAAVASTTYFGVMDLIPA